MTRHLILILKTKLHKKAGGNFTLLTAQSAALYFSFFTFNANCLSSLLSCPSTRSTSKTFMKPSFWKPQHSFIVI